MPTLEKTYLYKVSRNGVFLGNLPNVASEFKYSQDINAAGSAVQVVVNETIDRSEIAEPIETEDGQILQDESGNTIYAERAPDAVGDGNPVALIRNNNDVAIYEISDTYPTGKLVFSGYISRWKARFSANTIEFTILSYGTELDNYVIQGSETLDQQNTTQDVDFTVSGATGSGFGQTITVGGSVDNMISIAIKARIDIAETNPQTAIIELWNNPSDAAAGINRLAYAERSITNPANFPNCAEYVVTFPTPAEFTAGQQVFVTATAPTGSIYFIGADSTNGYAAGTSYGRSMTGAPWVVTAPTAYDMYFKTYYTAGATSSPFTSQDPTAIVRTIIDSYVNRGGTINYASGTTILTGLSVSYTFKINTVLEGIRKALELSPYDWYWYVDVATSILYFKETSTTADHTMILGQHIQDLEIQQTIENVKNAVYLSGGDVGGGVNLFLYLADAASLAANRVGLARISDNRVTLTATATAIAQNFLDENSDPVYESTLEVNADAYDITLFKPGQTIGFSGFANFIDNLILQIVSINYTPDKVTLGLGVLPKKSTVDVEELKRAVKDLETVDNPSIPS